MRNGVIVSVALIVILAGAGAGYVVGNASEHSTTLYSTTFFTQTITIYTGTTTTITITAASNQTTPLSRSNGDWVFSIRLQNSLLAMGQEFALSYNLTNISGQPQTVHAVSPLVNPTIYSANGTEVWAWNPPTFNGITTIPYGAGSWSEPLDIPTSALSAGQKYVLSVYPLIGANTTSAASAGAYSIGESLMINTIIGVT